MYEVTVYYTDNTTDVIKAKDWVNTDQGTAVILTLGQGAKMILPLVNVFFIGIEKAEEEDE